MKLFYSISLSVFFLCLTFPSIAHSHQVWPISSFSDDSSQAVEPVVYSQQWKLLLTGKKNSAYLISLPDSLPFRLLEFTATKKEKPILLEWQTADEQNSDKFIIEQSRDGQEFISIGEIEAKGASSVGPNRYLFTDKDPAHGDNYYRLIMIDRNGTYNYTTAQKIYNGVEPVVTLYPNPARKSVTVKGIEEYESVILTNSYGKKLIEKTIRQDTEIIDISTLPNGIYLIQLTKNGEQKTLKLVKKD